MTCELSLPYSKVKRAAVTSEAGSSVLAPQPLALAPAALLPSPAVSLHLGHLCARGWADPVPATPVSCPSIHPSPVSTRAAADPEVLATPQLLFFSHESIGINGHFIRVIKCGCILHLYPALPPPPAAFTG